MTDPRPNLDADSAAVREGRAAVERLVEELQAGLGDHDADLYDHRFAANVLWGSPFGETIAGFGALHDVHVRFQARGVAKASRFEIVRVAVPVPGVAIAQVRRIAGGAAAEPAKAEGVPNAAAFSEMALYVLIRKEGDWWLAAGQNTPIRPPAQ
jgi:uncharacterized protein (TIGR02246 family)